MATKIPDTRFQTNGEYNKKACAKCGHGITIHHPVRGGKRNPCWFPGCRCKNYQLFGRKVR